MGKREDVTVCLAKGGVSNWSILLPANAGIVERFAADELAKYVKKISGAKIMFADPAGAKPVSNVIHIGLRRELAAEFGIDCGPDGELPTPAEGFDGYELSITPERIVIAGENPRGALYGVYDILERLGCRWYHPALDPKDKELIPESPDLYLDAGSFSAAGKVELRIYNGGGFFFKVVPEIQLAQIDWAAKNRYNTIGWQPHHGYGRLEGELEEMKACGSLAEMEKRGLMLHGPCHSFQHFLPTEDYFEEHPEWFGMMNGERRPHGGTWPMVNFCWSNEEAVETFISNVEKFIKKWPMIKILNLEWLDGGQVCECPECRKRGGPNLIVELFNKVSERLEKVAPDVIVETVLGYPPIEELPDGAQPNGKWQGLYAHWGRSLTQSYNDPYYGRRANLLVWSTYCKEYGICSYYGDSALATYFGAPILHNLKGDTDFLVSHKVKESYILHFPQELWWNFSYNMTVAGHFSYYYPNRTPMEILRDYALNYYGPVAGPLLADFYDMLGFHIEVCGRAHGGDASDWDMVILREFERMIKRAEQMVAGDELISYRVRKLAAIYGFMLNWAQSRKVLNGVRDLYEKYKNGEADMAEVEKAIEEGRAYADGVLSHAADIEGKYAGIMSAEWFKSWFIDRVFLSELNDVYHKLKGIEPGPKSEKPDHVVV